MIILPADIHADRLRKDVDRLLEFLEASLDDDCKGRMDLATLDPTTSRLLSAVKQTIDAVAQARRERDEVADRLALVSATVRYAYKGATETTSPAAEPDGTVSYMVSGRS